MTRPAQALAALVSRLASRLGRRPPAAERRPDTPWAAAYYPQEVYGEGRPASAPSSERAGIQRPSFSIGRASAPIDHCRQAGGWEIGPDEALDASHPCVAVAYSSRMRELDEAAPAAGSERLALDVSGLGRAGDAPDPAWLARVEASEAAKHFHDLMVQALPKIAALGESRALGAQIAPGPARKPSRL